LFSKKGSADKVINAINPMSFMRRGGGGRGSQRGRNWEDALRGLPNKQKTKKEKGMSQDKKKKTTPTRETFCGGGTSKDGGDC